MELNNIQRIVASLENLKQRGRLRKSRRINQKIKINDSTLVLFIFIFLITTRLDPINYKQHTNFYLIILALCLIKEKDSYSSPPLY